MGGILSTIISVLVAMMLSGGASNMAEVTPQEAADAFLQDMSGGDKLTTMSYMDNRYVNFLENVKGTDEEMQRLEDALFRNFSYEITDAATKDNIAVVKATVKNCDFSGVMDGYEKESYNYVTDNLYSENVIDKEKLNKKCLDIYLDQIQKTSGGEPSYEKVVFIPMEEDGYGGWRIILSDDIMEAMLGELELPVNE